MKFTTIFIFATTLLCLVNMSFSSKLRSNTQGIEKFDPEKQKARGEALKNILWIDHTGAISQATGGLIKKYTISIRETGGLSVKRIAEGAKAKPHTILEKSIKESSMVKAYGANWQVETAKFFSYLQGYAGHYGSDKKLLGVRADNPSEQLRTSKRVKPCVGIPSPCEYVPTDDAIAMMKDKNWIGILKSQLYTGDYDIHEIYDSTNKIIPEATDEKKNALNQLNKSICDLGVKGGAQRCGVFELKNGLIHIEKGKYYAMFQHGDQATYKMNQHLENKGKAGKAVVVKAVNEESGDPLAWCVKGKWYVTMNLAEHREFRGLMKLTAPSHWQTGMPLSGATYTTVGKK